MLEAKLIGFKEGFKIAIVWLVFFSYLVKNDKKSLIKFINSGIITSFIISIIISVLPEGFLAGPYISNIIATSFAFFLIASAAALFHASGTKLFGNAGILSGSFSGERTIIADAAVFVLTVVFFAPDSAGSILFLKELTFIRDGDVMTYVYALLGFILAVFIIFLVVRFYRPYWIGSYFDVPQLLLFLAIVKLLGSGIKGIAELSLVPSVQRGFMKFVHDFVHQTLLLFMVPDHPLLKATVWNFIGIFFGADLASYTSLIILLFFPLMFIYFSLFRPLPEPVGKTAVQKRKIKSLILSDRRKKALPVILFTGLILITWFSQRGETVSQIYVPEPRPVLIENNFVNIPLKDPTMDVRDGRLHKFSFIHENEEIRIIVFSKPDSSLSVSLDACEICPPEGYGQRGDHVVCLYCRTPIHIDTLGSPGGCNPVPLSAAVDSRFIRIRLSEILDKWGFVQAGKGRAERR